MSGMIFMALALLIGSKSMESVLSAEKILKMAQTKTITMSMIFHMNLFIFRNLEKNFKLSLC